MCSGKTHDKITYLCTPIVSAITFSVTKNINDTLLVTGNFLVAGLAFGPDLDLRSIQTKRWERIGLGWIWKPYQKLIPRHRHPMSHGFILGTIVRLLYLSPILTLIAIAFNIALSWHTAILIFIGLEAGAMSHAIADFICSNFCRGNHENKRINQRTTKVRS